MSLTLTSDLRRLRKHLGMTQWQLARAIGVSVKTIGEHERGHTRIPRERMLAVLCLCLWAVMTENARRP